MTQGDIRKKPSLLQRLGILGGTMATLGVATLLVVAGTGVIADRANEETASHPVAPVPVQIVQIDLQDSYLISATYRGRLEAAQQVDIGFETGGTVIDLLVEEGDQIEQGQVLARLDTQNLNAQRSAEEATRDALAAQVELARRTLERQSALNAKDFSSAQALDEVELSLVRLNAELRRAEAAINATKIAIEKAVLLAPFDAQVGRRVIDEGARIQPGQALFTLFENQAPQFRVGVPSSVAAQLESSTGFEITMNGAPVAAVLERMRTDINAATRTRDLIFSLSEDMQLPTGTLGTLRLDRSVTGQGAWVPTSALSEGIRGLWTVFVVDDGVTRREAVELVHLEADRAYVRGHLQDGSNIVAIAPHRLSDGQAVALAES